jgi:hypothetical protein
MPHTILIGKMVNALQQFIVTIGDVAGEFRDCYDGVMALGS